MYIINALMCKVHWVMMHGNPGAFFKYLPVFSSKNVNNSEFDSENRKRIKEQTDRIRRKIKQSLRDKQAEFKAKAKKKNRKIPGIAYTEKQERKSKRNVRNWSHLHRDYDAVKTACVHVILNEQAKKTTPFAED